MTLSPLPKVVRANAKQLVVLEDAFHRGVDASSNSAIWEALLSKTGLYVARSLSLHPLATHIGRVRGFWHGYIAIANV
ncbi:unnamed protein product [Mycena citricolor]|uniref:Uncharacterized protein n=1 Tax=Mycena citricolor TaxID=2018698 RepID=A0AAD2GZ14_9AGAR|nr:unnamed protein product [Mycena citricolor]